ncbi:MAG: magnesium transporter CorA family protein [Patescibacteria group bacterium]
MQVVKFGNLQWIDIVAPCDDDIRYLEDHFGFHQLILQEVRTPTLHPLVAEYEGYLFLVLHFPNQSKNTGRVLNAEIDFLITTDTIVSVRYQTFDDFQEQLHSMADNHDVHKTTGHLFHAMAKHLFSSTFPELDGIKKAVDDAEDAIFAHVDDANIERLADIKRKVLDILRALRPQESVWESFHTIATRFWGEGMRPYLSDLDADYNRVLHFAEMHLSIIDSIHVTASFLLDNRRNNVMKVLTLFTAIILPLSLITSIFGMNFTHIPYAANPQAFYWLIAGMVASTILMIVYFRNKKWL